MFDYSFIISLLSDKYMYSAQLIISRIQLLIEIFTITQLQQLPSRPMRAVCATGAHFLELKIERVIPDCTVQNTANKCKGACKIHSFMCTAVTGPFRIEIA